MIRNTDDHEEEHKTTTPAQIRKGQGSIPNGSSKPHGVRAAAYLDNTTKGASGERGGVLNIQGEYKDTAIFPDKESRQLGISTHYSGVYS